MQFYRIKQLAELTGKSERTLQRILQKIKEKRPNYYQTNTRKSPNEPRATEVNDKIISDYNLIKPENQTTEPETIKDQPFWQELLRAQVKQNEQLHERLKEQGERIKEMSVNLNLIMQKIPQLEAPKNNNYNATSDDLSEGIVVGEEQSSPEKKEPIVTDFKQTKKEPKKSRSTTHRKQNKGLRTQATRAKKGQNRKKITKKPGFWKKVGNWLNS